jgi:hypothetical protein
VNLCVFGCDGNMGKRHMDAAKYVIPNVRGVDIGQEPDASMDVAVVATPTVTHLDVVTQIFEKWNPAFLVVEKPCGNSLAECGEILSLCNANGCTLIVSYQRRFDPVLRVLDTYSQPLTIEVEEEFTHLCHLYDMRTWYGKIVDRKVKKIDSGRSLEIYMREKLLERCLINSLRWFYGVISNNETTGMCVGPMALHPHIVNEYG